MLSILRGSLSSKIHTLGNKILDFKVSHNMDLISSFLNSKGSNNLVPIKQDSNKIYSNSLEFNQVLSNPNPNNKISTHIHSMEVKEVPMLTIFDKKMFKDFEFININLKNFKIFVIIFIS